MKQEKLDDLLAQNPQIDTKMLKKALEESKKIQKSRAKMVNFNITVPYASDEPSILADIAWCD